MKEPIKILSAALIFAIIFSSASCAGGGKNQANEMETDKIKNDTTYETMAEQTEIPPESAQEESTQETTEMKMKITVGETEFTATLADNSTVDELVKLMTDEPLTLEMSDYAGMEKGVDLETSLPQNNEQMNTKPGDIILYQGRTLVIYYDTNSWSLTPIGKIDDVDEEKLRDVLGDGDVMVTFSVE